MKKFALGVGVAAGLALSAGSALAATTTIDVYPGNFEGWGIPGGPPDGNFGGFRFGTTTNPTFVDGASGTKTSPGDGRGSVWWGNDGGTGDQLVGESSGTGGSESLFANDLVSSLASFRYTMWRSSVDPVTAGAVHVYVGTGIHLLMDSPNQSGSMWARIEPRWIQYGKHDQTTYASVATTMAARNDQWFDWEFDRTDQVLEFDGNVPGTTFASDAWDGTGSPKGKLVSLDQLETWDPDLFFTDVPRNTTNPNGGGVATSSVEIINNVFGNRHDTWLDDMEFTFGGGNPDGDANSDGTVNGLDLSIMASNWQTAVGGGSADGDFNGDGTVNGLDLSILAANWQTSGGGDTYIWNFTTGAGGSSGGGVSFDEALGAVGLGGIPEPSSMLLLGAGSLLLMRRRR